MLEKIENILNKGGRKQRGRKQLKSRVNITYPIKSIAIYANKDVEIRLEQLKQIKSDLTRANAGGLFKIMFTVFPNKPFTKKGILVRMGKGKGKIDHFSCKITSGTICLILIPPTPIKGGIDQLTLGPFIKKFERKYPFLSFKYPPAQAPILGGGTK